MKALKYIIKEWLLPILAAIILAMLIKELLFFQVKVPSGSMYPTIKVGDRILVTKVYNKKKLKSGDIIVFKSDELKEVMIKRLIGLPGDVVVVKDKGRVFINGSEIAQPYVVNKEDLNIRFKVPENKYLFFGDNRASSLDARKWRNPYIDGKDIKGKAQFITYPFKRFGKFVIGNAALNH